MNIVNKGAVRKTAEYVPAVIPIISASEKALKVGPPKKKIADKTKMVVSDVLRHLASDWLMLLFTVSSKTTLTLFDKHDANARESCMYAGAGMIAPNCELEEARAIINQLGLLSLELWPEILKKLSKSNSSI